MKDRNQICRQTDRLEQHDVLGDIRGALGPPIVW